MANEKSALEEKDCKNNFDFFFAKGIDKRENAW